MHDGRPGQRRGSRGGAWGAGSVLVGGRDGLRRSSSHRLELNRRSRRESSTTQTMARRAISPSASWAWPAPRVLQRRRFLDALLPDRPRRTYQRATGLDRRGAGSGAATGNRRRLHRRRRPPAGRSVPGSAGPDGRRSLARPGDHRPAGRHPAARHRAARAVGRRPRNGTAAADAATTRRSSDEPAHPSAARVCRRRADPDCAAGVRTPAGDEPAPLGGVPAVASTASSRSFAKISRARAPASPNGSRRSRARSSNDNRFRLAAVAGVESEREYLLDYAGTAMRLTGLSMLQIQDGDGRIISSGHFRNEHGRIESGLAAALSSARALSALVDRLVAPTVNSSRWRASSRSSSAAARSPSSAASRRRGVSRDAWRAIERSSCRCTTRAASCCRPVEARRRMPRTTRPSASCKCRVIRSGAGAPLEVVQARLQVTQPLTPLRTLLRSADSWFLLTAAGTGLTALLLAVWVSSRISGPLAALAEKTAVLDLDRLDVEFDAGTDEVGTLSRLLGDLAARLRTSTARVREAERRATVGELARQINHDIKNGLIPLRNVMRHLAQVERDDPRALARGVRRAAADRRFQHRVSRDAGHQLPATVAAARPARVRRERADRRRRPGRAGTRAGRVRDRPGESSPGRRRSDRASAYPRKSDRQRRGQPGPQAGPHHRLDARGRTRARARRSSG